VLLSAAAAYTSGLVFERQDAISKVSRYSVTWTTMQAGQEVSRLQAAVAAFGATRQEPERQAVELWVDLLKSRVTILQRGEAGAFIRSSEELAGIVGELAAAAEAIERELPALEDPACVRRLLQQLQQLNPRMARLSSLAYAHGSELSGQDARELSQLYWQFSGLLVALILSCLTLAAIAAWRNRLLIRANDAVQSLVDDLTRTRDHLTVANRRVQDAMGALESQNAVLKARDAELGRQNELFDAALNNMSQGLGMFDAEHHLIVCNRRFGELLGLDSDQALPGAHASELLSRHQVPQGAEKGTATSLWATHAKLADSARASSFVLEDHGGRALYVSHRPMANGGWVATYEDVTESRRAEARIRHLANHDALTGLPNRWHFHQKLEEAIQSPSGSAAVLLLDLDHFKNVNDTLGHHVGDELLRAAAGRIRTCVREQDLVARLGGDEFAVLVKDASADLRVLGELATRVAESLSAPFSLGHYQASIGASVGIATSAGHSPNVDTLLKHADVALYRAKAAGRGRYQIFESSMAAELQDRMQLEADLRSALQRDEFTIHYQPIVDIGSGSLSGFEALLRWEHPEKGVIAPADFIPIAEDTGLIVPISEWALRRACEEAMSFPHHVKVSVNISAVQFANGNLPQVVRETLGSTGLAPRRLALEITESVLLQDSEAVLSILHRLRGMGVQIVLDDFGTKYSSLSYLRSFPFDKIKIDRSFIQDMRARKECFAIVRSVSLLAAQLNMTTTAEGVENLEQLALVREAGCNEAQGFHLGRPVPLPELAPWLATAKQARAEAAL
jgi:diguanylate cyclase (GGDEF)-like protein